MNLLEHEAKQEFAKYNIPVPKGELVVSSSQIEQAVSKLRSPYMVKAQVLSGGRGKAGGIIPATSVQEVEEAVAKLFQTKIRDLAVNHVLVEEKIPAKKELYIGITVDRFDRSYVVMASSMGGVEIEEVAQQAQAAIIKTKIDAQLGIRSFHALSIAKKLGYNANQLIELSDIIQKLYRTCIENDAEMVEINPLIETQNGNFVAVDARMTIDDNALFRHAAFEAKKVQRLSTQEALALKNNLAYVKLDGDIGVVGNGAGLVMATLDLLNLCGGKPANFLDLGGGATIKSIKAALEIVLANPNTKTILVNVLGGITHCDEVARGIIEVTKHAESKKSFVVRLVGTNQIEGQKILKDAGISVLNSMEEAARQAVKFAEGEKSNGNLSQR